MKKRAPARSSLSVQAQLFSWFFCRTTSVHIQSFSITPVSASLYVGVFMSHNLISSGRMNTDSWHAMSPINTTSLFIQVTQRSPASSARDTMYLLAAGKHCNPQSIPCLYWRNVGGVHVSASMIAI